jgi:hypothetical protein
VTKLKLTAVGASTGHRPTVFYPSSPDLFGRPMISALPDGIVFMGGPDKPGHDGGGAAKDKIYRNPKDYRLDGGRL